MPNWLGGILLFGAILGGVFLWESLKDKAKAKGGKAAAAANSADKIESGIGWTFRILFGLVVLAAGLFFLWLGVKEGAWEGWLIGIVGVAYGINVLRGGSIWIIV